MLRILYTRVLPGEIPQRSNAGATVLRSISPGRSIKPSDLLLWHSCIALNLRLASDAIPRTSVLLHPSRRVSIQYCAPFHPLFATAQFVSRAYHSQIHNGSEAMALTTAPSVQEEVHEFRHRRPPKCDPVGVQNPSSPIMHHNQPQSQPPTLIWIISQSMTALSIGALRASWSHWRSLLGQQCFLPWPLTSGFLLSRTFGRIWIPLTG